MNVHVKRVHVLHTEAAVILVEALLVYDVLLDCHEIVVQPEGAGSESDTIDLGVGLLHFALLPHW